MRSGRPGPPYLLRCLPAPQPIIKVHVYLHAITIPPLKRCIYCIIMPFSPTLSLHARDLRCQFSHETVKIFLSFPWTKQKSILTIAVAKSSAHIVSMNFPCFKYQRWHCNTLIFIIFWLFCHFPIQGRACFVGGDDSNGVLATVVVMKEDRSGAYTPCHY